jgi:LacI family transcriptional regulator
MSMRVTIKQIAEMAGVNRSTVDKVIHNRGGVSKEVKQRILKIIDEIGYSPNIIGKALKYQNRRIKIAVVLLRFDALEEIKAGIEQAYSEFKDFGLEIEYYILNNNDIEEQLSIINLLKNRDISGLIISPIDDIRIGEVINEIAENNIPVVTTNSDLSESKRLCYVGQDVMRAGRVAGKLMAEILGGKGNVAVITGSHKMLSVSKRMHGFQQIINERFPGINIINVIETFEDSLTTFQKTLWILENEKELDGIYITCGGVGEVCKAVKLQNKEKRIKIISFDLYPDTINLLKEGVISFSIGQDLFSQGYKPVRILFDYIFMNKVPELEYLYTAIDVRMDENI